jgi:hypothetical protein
MTECDLNISFEAKDDKHFYIIKWKNHNFRGNIAKVSWNLQKHKNYFSISTNEALELQHEIVNRYVAWNKRQKDEVI